MSFVERRRPRFTEAEAGEIARNFYGISGSVVELPSERDQNFRITDRSNEFILKIASALEQNSTLEMQNQAMEQVGNRTEFEYTQRLRKNSENQDMTLIRDSAGGQHFVRVLTYLPGVPLALYRPHSVRLLRNLGKALANVGRTLLDFGHPASRRDLRWDFDRAGWVLTHFGTFVSQGNRSRLLEYFLNLWRRDVVRNLGSLRKSVVYHDANEYNVLVHSQTGNDEPQIRLIDFGDMLFTYTIADLAIGCAYSMLDKPDPLSAASEVVRGYHPFFPLTELEISLLYYFICMRLCMSVSICAFQQQEEPANEYLKVSELPAWRLLEILGGVHPRLAAYTFRSACGLEPHPDAEKLRRWLRDHLPNISPVQDVQSFGKYGEVRFHDPPRFRVVSNEGFESRSIHLGVDYFGVPGVPVRSLFGGTVHSFRDNVGEGDYGPTIVVEHRADGIPFFVLYGHLSAASLCDLYCGKRIQQGEQIGRIGTYDENGNWPPHAHVQIILDLLDEEATFPGLCTPHEREIYSSLCPNLNPDLAEETIDKTKIVQLRKEHFSDSLSISYATPLHIIQGRGQYLFDEKGRPYLDCVNNVCHVGHSNPDVVQAASAQMSILNTNTRYLHKKLVEYAQRLCRTLPDPLKVCFLVCSGSEANDLALRLARAYTRNKNTVVVEGAYHGNLSSLIEISPYKFNGPGGSGPPSHVRTVMMPDRYRGPFAYSDPEAGQKYAQDVRRQIASFQDSRAVTFIVESALGCGGQIILPEGYLQSAFAFVRDHGGVCIADEVQVGFGRVGSHFWCFETQDVVPDIVTMGKPIGNGHPLAAVVTTQKIAAAFENGMEYFNTFGGNPVSCAVGLAVLNVIEKEKLQAHAMETGGYLKSRLQQLKERHRLIGDIRGLGFFIGIEFVKDREKLTPAREEAAYIVERMKDRGILLSTDGPFHNVIKIKPPLIFSRENADSLVENLDWVLGENILSGAGLRPAG